MPERPEIRWVCVACGSDEIEGRAWLSLNRERFAGWDEGAYACASCKAEPDDACAVNADGRCVIHGRSFDECRRAYAERQRLALRADSSRIP
jgi:hypothetical protein